MDYSQIGYDFSVLNRRSQAYIAWACRHWQIGYAEYVVLLELYDHNGCSQDELRRILFVDKALIARCAKSLELKGLICRRQDQKDRRIKRLSVTAEGWRMQPVLQTIRNRWIDAITSGMDETLVAQTVQGLRTVVNQAAALPFSVIFPEGDERV